jgi:hypothetical protein
MLPPSANGTAAAPASVPAPVPAVASAPAPAPPPPPPSPPPVTGEFWVQQTAGQPPTQLSAAALQEWLHREIRDPATVQVCRVGTSTWRTAAVCGFTDAAPF